ncbi:MULTISPECIES: Bug family tripartite tricarboxylate transporter substrate binding protein [unclassified Bradyrhizobium]|uniref:Bug family tripartite tricarboxylate transporter substrate binding protein n=1 Tax=unclassified Bradyrhizobium TaxID=2631580 RepID=UPI002FF2B141
MIDRRSLLLGGALASIARPALSQTKYPNRTVTMVSPFAAGGQLEPIGRIISKHMQSVLGQAFVIENRPGAGGTIGAQYVTRSAPDGSTLLLGTTSTFVIAPYIFKPQPYDPLVSLAPIIALTENATVLIASEKSGFKSLKDLLEAAKQKPANVTVASAGNGSFPHVFSELFSSLTDVKLTHIPYRGGAPAMNDLIGGQVDIFFEVVPSAIPQIQSKQAFPLLVSGNKRVPLLADVPTAAEMGYPDLNLTSWNGLAAPAGTPASVIEILNKESNEALRSEEMTVYLDRLGISAIGGSPKDMAARMAQESAIYKRLIESRGITVQ